MPLWSPQPTEPVDRWGAVFFFAGVAFDVYILGGNDVTLITLRILTLMTACFLGPAVVRLAEHLTRQEWSGLGLGAVTFAACTVITALLRLLLRNYF